MTRRDLTCGLAVVLTAAAAIAGCSDDGDTIVLGSQSQFTPTRADQIATPVDASWSDNASSINFGQADDFEAAQAFPCTDGAGILAWNEGDDGGEHLYLAFYDTHGGVVNQAHVKGDFDTSPFDAQGEAADNMIVTWTPAGDAVIAFIARQSRDASDPTDSTSERVYVGTFKRTLARTAKAPTGERYGFSAFRAVDTNVTGTDDNGVRNLFVATNLLDGGARFRDQSDAFHGPLDPTGSWLASTSSSGANRSYLISGPRADSPNDLTPFLFLGWVYDDGNADGRVEGHFVDLNDADRDGDRTELASTSPVQLTFPALGTGESVHSTVHTSGRDLLFTATDVGTPNQDRMYLVRVNTSTTTPTLDGPFEISRGTNTNVTSTITTVHALLGDGYRPLNGQTTTWVVYSESGFEDATVTQADADLLIAQVDASGVVSVSEFDHNGATAVNPNDVSNVQVQVQRGATRAFVYYQQTFVTGGPQLESALHVRALRLDGAETLADNVSNEATVNDMHDSDGDGDANVLAFEVVEQSPFHGACVNVDTSYVAFRQFIDEETDGHRLVGRLVTIDDITASPITISLEPEDVIVTNHDTDWSENSFQGGVPLIVLPGSASTGEGIVFYAANGNSPSDNTATNSFNESRPFVYAAALGNSQSISPAVQVGSDSAPNLVPFPQFKVIERSTSVGLQAIATPWRPAARDFAFDDDEAAPETAHFVVAEEERTGNEEGSTYVGRTLDLRDRAGLALADRWSPSLSQGPHIVGPQDGEEFDDLNEAAMLLIPEGSDVVAVFNISRHEDSGPGEGGFIFINTFTNGAWSDAALLSNDSHQELDDEEEPFHDTGMVFGFAPGVQNGQPRALGTWTFWTRWEYNGDNNGYVFKLQGRRLTSTSLPRR